MAKKRKMVQSNLVKNAVAAYFAVVEIHNKPNISYRYETVTLLLVNAAMPTLDNPDLYFKKRRTDPLNKRSAGQKFYTELGVYYIKQYFLKGIGQSSA